MLELVDTPLQLLLDELPVTGSVALQLIDDPLELEPLLLQLLSLLESQSALQVCGVLRELPRLALQLETEPLKLLGQLALVSSHALAGEPELFLERGNAGLETLQLTLESRDLRLALGGELLRALQLRFHGVELRLRGLQALLPLIDVLLELLLALLGIAL